jgi:hypothetical protein
MKKFMMLATVMLAMLFSLGGCFLPQPWHDGGGRHDRGHDRGRHDRHWDRGHDNDRDGDRYERR